MGFFGAVLVFIKTAFRPVRTSVAGARGTVSSGTFEGDVLGTVRRTEPAMDALAIIGAFKGQLTFMGKGPVKPDLLADSRFVLTDRLSDSGLGGAVGNTGKDDAPFFQSQMGK